MKLPDAIAPYAHLAKWLVLAVILLVAFIGGCNHGTNKQAARDAGALADADRRADADAAQIAILAATLVEIDKAALLEEEAAKAQAKQADAAVKRTEQADTQFKREVAGIDREIATARRDPTCREILEAKPCAPLH